MAGLTSNQARVLRILADRGPLTATEIGVRAGRPRHRASAWAWGYLDPLRGLLLIEPSPGWTWSITPAGREALAAWERDHG